MRPPIVGCLQTLPSRAGPAIGSAAISEGMPRSDGGARRAPECALACGHCLFLFPHAGLLVVLALAQLGEDAGLLALLLEAPDGALDGLVLLDADPGHGSGSPLPHSQGAQVIPGVPQTWEVRTIREKHAPVKANS